MVPISALRETIVLVIFGIVLVPIAAKRAQDAPGYWKAFAVNAHQSLVYHDPQPPTPAFALSTNCGDAVSCSHPENPYTVRNGTASLGPLTTDSRPEAQGRLTLRFRMSKSELATRAAMTEVAMEAEATEASDRAVTTAVDGAVSPTVTTTSAANRERWTLIWMGTAITVVAVLMSLC